MVKVLFVCTGNICRSPTAEGVFRHLVAQAGLADYVQSDSAAIQAYHVGEPPDPRTQHAARKRGINLSHLRARKVTTDDFHRFDYVLAMDSGHYRHLNRIVPLGFEPRVELFLRFAPDIGLEEVPDPYYGGADGFERVLDLCERGSRGLLDHIRQQLQIGKAG